MRILRVEIKNFRGIRQADIDLPGHALFVGPNNACKTAILDALDLALGPDRGRGPDAIDEHDFFRGNYYGVVLSREGQEPDDEDPETAPPGDSDYPDIRVVVTLGSLGDEDRVRFRAHLEPWHHPERRPLTPDELDASTLGPEDYVLRVGFRGWYDDEEDDFDTQSYFLNPVHPDGSRDSFGRRSKQAVGFLYLRSFRTARRAASLARGSLLETLLRTKVSGTQLWESLLRAMAGVGDVLEGNQAVREALDDIEGKVRELTPLAQDRGSGIHVSRLTRQHLRDTLTYFLASQDSDHLLPYDRLGSGTSNVLVLALLAAIAEAKANVIFAMEEPEIALPPHAQRTIVQLLKSQAAQALVTSHSPYVGELFLPNDMVVVRRVEDGTLASATIRASGDVEEKTLRRDFRTRFAEGMLARAVLLVEGPTELWALPACIDVLTSTPGTAFRSFDLDGMVILPSDGAGEIPKLGGYFGRLGIPVHVFCDSVDAGEEAAIRSQADSVFIHPYSGFELLVATELPIAALRRITRQCESWPDYPRNITPLDETEADESWRERCRKLLKMRKGEGWAQRFLSECSPDELPLSVVTGVAHLHFELGRSPLPAEGHWLQCFSLPTQIRSLRSSKTRTVSRTDRGEITMLSTPTTQQEQILGEESDLLVVGPPGTGKTTVALAKAAAFVEKGNLGDHEAVLFLSFSNAAVHRIREAAQGTVPHETLRRITITTFHGFCYSVLAGHRRLARLGQPFRLLLPEDHVNVRSRMEGEALEAELSRLESEEGRVRFDRFPALVAEIFERHPTIRDAYAVAHPLILVDEYQDTTDDQDDVLQLLSRPGQVVYLGDPDQRIYDFVTGTRPDRIARRGAADGIVSVRLDTNHRNSATDIAEVADAILAGRPRIPKPKDVHIVGFGNRASQITMLKRSIVRLEKYLKNNLPAGARRSIAVMARTNDYLAGLSASLLETDDTWEYPFRHHILLNPDAVAIAWDAVMGILEPGGSTSDRAVLVLESAARLDRLKLRSATRLRHAEKLEHWANQLRTGRLDRRASGVHALLDGLRVLPDEWKGDPAKDCGVVVELIGTVGGTNFDQLTKVLELRAPVGGPYDLAGPLGEIWIEQGDYAGARAVADAALLQERMELGSHSGSSRVLMTLHKCKGKQFDAVIVVDGHHGPTRLASSDVLEARRLLRVALTRARCKALILTPTYDRCPLLPMLES